MRYSLAKVIVSIVLVVWYLTMPQVGFCGFGIHEYGVLSRHISYPLCHANIWHLMANILCLWSISCRMHLSSSYIIAVLCSFLPCFLSEPTTGFSGVLFALVGISWGRTRRFKDMLWRNKWFLVVPVFIPHVNAFLHFYCLVAGYLAGMYCLTKPNKTDDWI